MIFLVFFAIVIGDGAVVNVTVIAITAMLRQGSDR
jgi:hypothetical protein